MKKINNNKYKKTKYHKLMKKLKIYNKSKSKLLIKMKSNNNK